MAIKVVILVLAVHLHTPSQASCLSQLRRDEIAARIEFLAKRPLHPKHPSARIYYPKDFVEGEERDVIVYMHGFASSADSYGNKAAGNVSVQEKISAIYSERSIKEPVVLSFSMGPRVLAGLESHGADHPYFLPVKDYWDYLQLLLEDLPLDRRKLFFLANSAGAFNVFQMLRDIPKNLQVDRVVLCALPNFTNRGLAKNPAFQYSGTNLDPSGTNLRVHIEPLITSFFKDPTFVRLLPYSALLDRSLPRNIPMLIQGGAWDAFGYTQLNSELVDMAELRDYPISMRILPGGHSDGIDNQATVDFFLEEP